jgi:hypothetical protein
MPWRLNRAPVGGADDAPRNFVALSEQGALFSPRVLEGERPRWAYRTEPDNELDSGWRFFEGSESDEWLNEPGNCILQHLGHALDQFPELRRIVRDDRVQSAWEWKPLLRRYREVRDWTRTGDEEPEHLD